MFSPLPLCQILLHSSPTHRFFCPSTLTLYEGASQYNVSCSIKSNPQISSGEIALLLETFPSVGAAGGAVVGGSQMTAAVTGAAVAGAASAAPKNKSTSVASAGGGENGRRLQRLKINAKSG